MLANAPDTGQHATLKSQEFGIMDMAPRIGVGVGGPPDGSTPLVPRLFPDVPPVSEERPPRIPLQMGLNSLAHTVWAPIFCDGAYEVLLVHQQTGAVRDAPWFALRTRDGCVDFANLLTRETRWLPPHLWMHGWVSRTEIPGTSPAAANSRSTMSQVLDNSGRDLPCDGRKPLPPSVAYQRVEGGAPYMYEPAHGTPQAHTTRRALRLAAHVPARGQL